MADLTGGYQKQTRDVYFKGRKAYDPSKQMYQEAEATAKRDGAVIKDMLRQEKELQEAWKVWDKNQKLVDDELIAFWKQMKDVPKTVTDTVIAGGKIWRDKSIEKANEDWENSTEEEKEALTKYYQGLLKESREVQNQRDDNADQAEALGAPPEIPAFLRGQNKHYLNTMMLKVGKEHLYSFDDVTNTVWTSNEKKYSWNGEPFAASDSGLTVEQENIVWRDIRKKMLVGMSAGGLDLKATNALLGKDLDELIDKSKWRRAEQKKRTQANNAQADDLGNIKFALKMITYNEDGSINDPYGAYDQIRRYSEKSYNRLARAGKGNPGVTAKNDLADMLGAVLAESADEDTQEIIHRLLLDKTLYLIPGTKDKYGSLAGDVDPKVFSINRFERENGQGFISSNGQTLLPWTANVSQKRAAEVANWKIKDAYESDGVTLKKDLDKVTLEKAKNTTFEKLNQLLINGVDEDGVRITEIPYGRLLEEAKLAAVAGADRTTILEILQFNGKTLSADETIKYLDGLNLKPGEELIIPEDAPRLDQGTLGDYAQRKGLEVGETYSTNDAQARLASFNAIEQEVTQGQPTTESHLIITEKLEDRVLLEEQRIRKEDQIKEGGPTKTRSEIIDEATAIVLGEFKEEVLKEDNEFYRDVDNNYPVIDKTHRRGWFGTTEERKAAENELENREISKALRNNNVTDKPLSATRKFPGLRSALVTASVHMEEHGVPPKILVERARAAGEDVYTFSNNQMNLYGLSKVNHIRTPPEAQTFLGAAKKGEVSNIIRLLGRSADNGGFEATSWDPRRAANRQLEALINRVHTRKGITAVRPSESAIRNSLSHYDNGGYSAERTVGTTVYLGRYRIRQTEAREWCKKLNIDWPGTKGFLNDTALQDKVANARISALLDQSKGDTTSARVNSFYELWSGATGEEAARQKIFFLNRYVNDVKGGQ